MNPADLNCELKGAWFMSYSTEMRNDQPQIFTRRRLACLLGASAVLGLPLSGVRSDALRLKLDAGEQPLPGSSLQTKSGQPLRLAEAGSQALLVNFWATWCGPCVVELPALETAAAHLREHSIKVVLVNVDRGGAEVAQPFLDKRQINTPLSAYDPNGEWARALKLRGLPTTLLIKQGLSGYASHTGPAEWASPAVLDQVTDYLG